MRSPTRHAVFLLASPAALLALIPFALGHGDEMGGMDGGMGMGMTTDQPQPEDGSYPPTYFTHPEHKGIIYAHIALMVVSWIFVLPVGECIPTTRAEGTVSDRLSAVMLSLARSRYALAAQFVFLAVNAVGVLFSVIYNTNTPDLYPNNAHHKLGWAVTWVACAHVATSLLGRVAGALRERKVEARRGAESESFIPVSRAAMEEHHRLNGSRNPRPYRLSDDSGQGTERNTESLRSHSTTASEDDGSIEMRESHKRLQDDEDDLEADLPALRRGGRAVAIARRAAGMIFNRFRGSLVFGYNVVDRIILILGFVAFSLGIATYGRFFVSTTAYGENRIFQAACLLSTGGPSDLYGSCTLDQRRNLLLDGPSYSRQVGGQLRRAWMGE